MITACETAAAKPTAEVCLKRVKRAHDYEDFGGGKRWHCRLKVFGWTSSFSRSLVNGCLLFANLHCAWPQLQ